jgi:hypothetical protein
MMRRFITNKPGKQNVDKIKRHRGLYKPYGRGQIVPPPPPLEPPVYLGGFAPPPGQVGVQYDYYLIDKFSGTVDGYNATNLPAGLSVAFGFISGIPTTVESPLVTANAFNDAGSTPSDPATLAITL